MTVALGRVFLLSWSAGYGRYSQTSAVLPNGPVTVTVLRGILRYVVASLLTLGSPSMSSTPGGIEIGVLPSLDGRLVVAEKDRDAALAWKAGTRKLGRVTAEAEVMTLSKALLLLGANIFGLVGAA